MVHAIPKRLQRSCRRFTLFADDSGTPPITASADGERHSFAFGGFVARDADVQNALEKWRNVREAFFGPDAGEIKASDYVSDDSPIPNLSGDTDRRAVWQGYMAFILETLNLRPVACIVDKSNAPEIFVKKTRKGGDAIDKIWPFETVAMQFGVFLAKMRARGRMICDEPGQGQPSDWIDRLAALQAKERDVARIESVSFMPSHESEGLQLADNLLGILRFMHERREIVRDGLRKLLLEAKSDGLGVFLPCQS